MELWSAKCIHNRLWWEILANYMEKLIFLHCFWFYLNFADLAVWNKRWIKGSTDWFSHWFFSRWDRPNKTCKQPKCDERFEQLIPSVAAICCLKATENSTRAQLSWWSASNDLSDYYRGLSLECHAAWEGLSEVKNWFTIICLNVKRYLCWVYHSKQDTFTCGVWLTSEEWQNAPTEAYFVFPKQEPIQCPVSSTTERNIVSQKCKKLGKKWSSVWTPEGGARGREGDKICRLVADRMNVTAFPNQQFPRGIMVTCFNNQTF